MIYHLLYDLQTQFPSYSITVEGTTQLDAQEYILIRETGGAARGYPDDRVDASVQVIVRHQDQYEARQIARNIYAHWRERHSVTLQPHPDSGESAILVRRLAATQPPYTTGKNADGTTTYNNNYSLTYQDTQL
jgi:hypothetical protein